MLRSGTPDICRQRLHDILLTKPRKGLLQHRHGLVSALRVSGLIPHIPDQNTRIVSIGPRQFTDVSLCNRLHLRIISRNVPDGVSVLRIIVKRCHIASAEIPGNGLRLRSENRLLIQPLCHAAVIKDDRHHCHMILIQKAQKFLQIFHKGIVLHSPQIERKEDSYTVKPHTGCQCDFLRCLLKCMLVIIFLQHPDHSVHCTAWNKITSADPGFFPIPGPDFFFCPTSFHRIFSLSPIFTFHFYDFTAPAVIPATMYF